MALMISSELDPFISIHGLLLQSKTRTLDAVARVYVLLGAPEDHDLSVRVLFHPCQIAGLNLCEIIFIILLSILNNLYVFSFQESFE
jgi:hypothetical protein